MVALVACSGPSKPPVHPDPPTDGGGGGGTTVAASDAPTAQECEALLGHTLEVANAERPPERRTDDSERARARDDLRSTFMPKCQAMTRTKYACALDAPNVTAMKACDE